MKEIEQLEQTLIIAMLKDIAGTNDPVEQFRAIERYDKFIGARAKRLDTDSFYIPNAASNRKTKD